MISSIVSLAVAKEVATAQLTVREAADKHYASIITRDITYDISASGPVTGDIEEFRKLVAEIYADPRGWVRAGIKFIEVPSNGQMHVVLATGDKVKAIAPTVCSEELSCRVGRYVMINDARWMNASDSYNELGVSLLDYRRMVVNHETGHFLGHDHIVYCETETGLGPVMLQQSTGLRGCKPNPWPLPSELWVKM